MKPGGTPPRTGHPQDAAGLLDPSGESRVQDAIGTIRAHAKLTDAGALKGPVRVLSVPTLRLIVNALIKEASTDEGRTLMVQEAAEARIERDQAAGRAAALQNRVEELTRERDELQGLLDTLQEDVTGKSARLAIAERAREELADRLRAQEQELSQVHTDREEKSSRVAALEERLGLASGELEVARQEAELVLESVEAIESRRLQLESETARLARRTETLMSERGMLAKSSDEMADIVSELRTQLRAEREAVAALERQLEGYREREEARNMKSGTRIVGVEDRNRALVMAMERLEADMLAERRRHAEELAHMEGELERLRASNLSARFPRKARTTQSGPGEQVQ